MARLLTEALADLERGDERAALEGLLAAWRTTPSTALADVIDALDERLRSKKPSIKKSLPLAEREAEWTRVASEGRVEEVGWLLAQPWPGKWEGALARLLILVKHDRDPRVARHLARVVDELPFDTWASMRFYRAAGESLGQAGDARALPALDRPERRRHNFEREYQALLAETAATLRAGLAAHAAPPPDDDAPLAALRARLGLTRADAPSTSADAAELLAAIAAAPDDDGPRQVYGDLLLERGDPRGDFIALQLARARGDKPKAAAARRERELLAAHRDAWLGRLRDLIDDEGATFERGFLDGVRLRETQALDAPDLFDDPAWRTVRRLDLGSLSSARAAPVVDRLSPSVAPGLRELVGLDSDATLRLLALADPPRLTTLGASLPVEAHPRLARFDRLRRLGLDRPHGWVAASPIWPRLEELSVQIWYAVSLGAWWRWVTSHPSALRRVRGGKYGERLRPNEEWEYDLERDDEGRFSRLTVRWLPCGSACVIDMGLIDALGSLRRTPSPRSSSSRRSRSACGRATPSASRPPSRASPASPRRASRGGRDASLRCASLWATRSCLANNQAAFAEAARRKASVRARMASACSTSNIWPQPSRRSATTPGITRRAAASVASQSKIRSRHASLFVSAYMMRAPTMARARHTVGGESPAGTRLAARTIRWGACSASFKTTKPPNE